MGHENIEDIIRFFNVSGFTWLVHMSGGEPFLHPRYVELCQKLTEQHYISINSNLSVNTVDEFIKQVNPKKVAFINCSLHIRERSAKHSVPLFIKRFKHLKKAGFHCYITQVFYPPLINQFGKIFSRFQKQGVIIHPKVFRGIYRKKLYPQSYTKEEKDSFLLYSSLAYSLEPDIKGDINPINEQAFINGLPSFKGMECEAGKKMVDIRYNGDIVRCQDSNKVLGNIFTGELNLHKEAQICPFSQCSCPYWGLKYT